MIVLVISTIWIIGGVLAIVETCLRHDSSISTWQRHKYKRLLALILGLFGGVPLTILWFRGALLEYGWSEPVAMVLFTLAVALAPAGIVGAVLVYKKTLIAGIVMLVSPIAGFVIMLKVESMLGFDEAYMEYFLGFLFCGPPVVLGGIISIYTAFKHRKQPMNNLQEVTRDEVTEELSQVEKEERTDKD